MKHVTKKWAWLLTAVALTLSVAGLVACGGPESGTEHDYTVKVLGPDGAPYTTALVQPCEVDASGELTMCYAGVATDNNGVAYLDLGKEIPNEEANEIEIHLLNLPSYYTYTSVRMKKGEEKTVNVTDKYGESGTGTGTFKAGLGGETTNQLDSENSDPYVVYAKTYRLKFTSATQKIYYAFYASEAGNYKVYSSGDIDASLIMLAGTNSIYRWEEERFMSEKVSDTDNNFTYEFEVSDSLVENEQGLVYFEVALDNAADVNKAAFIHFEYVDEYTPGPSKPQTVDVNAQMPLTPYTMIGTYIDATLNGSFTYTKDNDGYYHVGGNTDGELLLATLGKGAVTPRGLDKSFMDIYAQGQPFTFSDGVTYSKNYYPLVAAYADATNSEGRYPVTDELIEFLELYITEKYTVDLLEQSIGELLPAGEEWLVWCGYYEDGGYEQPNDEGTYDNPFTLESGMLTIDIPAGGTVYYAAYVRAGTTFTLMSDDTNIKLKAYNSLMPEDPTEAQSDSDGFYCEVSMGAQEYYFFEFSTKDGNADSYTVNVTEASDQDEEGTADNPEVLYYLGTFTVYVSNAWEGYYYTYTAEESGRLYFTWDANTTIMVTNLTTSVTLSSTDSDDDAKWALGLAVSAGDEIQIVVSTEDLNPGDATFGIGDAPFGSEFNPYTFETGTLTVNVPAGETVYYQTFSFFNPVKYIIMSDDTNIKLMAYSGPGDRMTAESTADGFYCEVTTAMMSNHYFAFTTKNGAAATYTVSVTEDEPTPEEGTEDNPIPLDSLQTVTVQLENGWDAIFYSYTVTSADAKLYFTWSTGAAIVVSYNEGSMQISSLDPDDDAKWGAGIEFPAGATISIMVMSADYEPGEYSFTISNQPING